MDIQIFRATKEHANDMGSVHSISWKKAYRGIIPDTIIDDFTQEKRAAIFSDVVDTHPEEYYLFKVNGVPAGIASLSKSHEDNAPNYIGEIYSIYFHPNFWETSATQKGLEFCIERLKSLGYKQITIWVLKDNIRACRFYEKNGFAIDEGFEQKIQIGKTLTEIRYSKKV